MAARKMAFLSTDPSDSLLIFNRLPFFAASIVNAFCLFSVFYYFCTVSTCNVRSFERRVFSRYSGSKCSFFYPLVFILKNSAISSSGICIPNFSGKRALVFP